MLVFVTGATGFLGSHVARALIEHGADLRLLVRASSNTNNIADLKADLVSGDLRDPASLERGIAGCDIVFHVAADYRLWVRDPAEMYRANVEGTRAILEAARKSNVRRVVYTSSVATMGFMSNGQPADENSPAYVDTGLNRVDSTECARGHMAALEKGRSGELYILGGKNLTLKQILEKLAAITELPSPIGRAHV